jgi:cyclase
MTQEVPNRIIARLDIKNDHVVKGLMMEGVQRVGNPIELAQKYYNQGADEILILDTVASLYQRIELPEIISEIVKKTFIPICAGGGIASTEDAEKLFYSGADKICLNTAAVNNPILISDLAKKFGSQSVVAQIDVKNYHNEYIIFINSGRDITKYKLDEWIKCVQDHGAGEILITSIDKDGMSRGADYELLKIVKEHCNVPFIYGGGIQDNVEIEKLFGEDIINLTLSSSLHYNDIDILKTKEILSSKGFLIRTNNQ